MHRASLVAAAAVVVAALFGVSTAHASRSIQKGISDDAQVLYGNPDTVFPALQQLNVKVLRVNLWWGGPNGVARRAADQPDEPG